MIEIIAQDVTAEIWALFDGTNPTMPRGFHVVGVRQTERRIAKSGEKARIPAWARVPLRDVGAASNLMFF